MSAYCCSIVDSVSDDNCGIPAGCIEVKVFKSGHVVGHVAIDERTSHVRLYQTCIEGLTGSLPASLTENRARLEESPPGLKHCPASRRWHEHENRNNQIIACPGRFGVREVGVLRMFPKARRGRARYSCEEG